MAGGPFTKIADKHDRILIDGVDYSNAFNEFGFDSEASEQDASGFSVSGVDETVPGSKAQGFAGTMFITEETIAEIFPLHFADTVVEVYWQKNGLVDPTATAFWANCTINVINARSRRGSVSTTPFTAKVADENGIQSGTGT